MDTIKVSDTSISPEHKPFVIAELSGNHDQSLERALELVRTAATTGVQAVKLQTYTADTMTINSDRPEFVINDKTSPWYGRNLYQLYQQAHTPWEWHQAIFDEARNLGLIAFSTPFDATAVDFLESLDTPAYKIASFENTDISLIRRVARTGKPVIISTGMATLADIDECVSACREEGCNDLILLKCTSSYPADPADSHLLTIPDMRQRFSCQVGLSDHTSGIGVAIASVALGATVIEKHFTLDRSQGGVDAAFSIEPQEMSSMVAEINRAWQALGEVKYGAEGDQALSVKYRRSLYVVRDLKKGDILTEKNVKSLRPMLGIPAKYLASMYGRSIKVDVSSGTPLSWDMVSQVENPA